MITCFVQLDKEGFICSWSDQMNNNYIEVKSDKKLVGMLDCVEVISNTATLNHAKFEEVTKKEESLSDIQLLQIENQQLKDNQAIQNSAISDLAEIVSEMMEV